MKLVKYELSCSVCETKSIVLLHPDDEAQAQYCPVCSSLVDSTDTEELEDE